MKFIYNLVFIKQNNQILMINRNKSPWMGMWNGLGGKLKNNETLNQSVIREIKEETNLLFKEDEIEYKGIVTWNDEFKTITNGLYLFLINLDSSILYETPIITNEGVITWKDISWVLEKDNIGVSYNIPYFLENVLNDKKIYHYHCVFDKYNLLKVETKEIT